MTLKWYFSIWIYTDLQSRFSVFLFMLFHIVDDVFLSDMAYVS